MNRRSTLADVARAAQVSKTTASMAVNGKGDGKIPLVTRQRVMEAANALHFRPHAVARALVNRCANVLGIVWTLDPFRRAANHPFEQALLSAIFYEALERGFNPMVYAYPGSSCSEIDFMRFVDGRSDAFLMLYPPVDCPLVRYLGDRDIPVVSLCSRVRDSRARWVDSDHQAGIEALVEHLASLGHRRIAYFIGPDAEDAVHTRVQTFQQALESRGLPFHQNWVLPYTWQTDITDQQIETLMSDPEPPSALLTWYDFAAEEIYRVLRGRGLCVPEDISVVGFDDVHPASTLEPPLTTVRQDVSFLAQSAVEMAISAVTNKDDGEDLPRHRICPVELVVRRSTQYVV